MKIPLQIIFHGIPPSDAVEAKIREKVIKLEKFHSHLMSCRVAVEAEHRHHHQGNHYHVRIDMTTPQREIVVSREHHDKREHEDVYVALRDAFDAAARQLKECARIQRGDVKTHEFNGNGSVAHLLPEQDHGLITTEEDRDIYFHPSSFIGKSFDAFEVNDAAGYEEEENELQASSVYA